MKKDQKKWVLSGKKKIPKTEKKGINNKKEKKEEKWGLSISEENSCLAVSSKEAGADRKKKEPKAYETKEFSQEKKGNHPKRGGGTKSLLAQGVGLTEDKDSGRLGQTGGVGAKRREEPGEKKKRNGVVVKKKGAFGQE